MHYEIIKDSEELKGFINWLPELEINEVYYGVLLARKKCCGDVKRIRSDSHALKQFISSKEHLYDTIAKLEVQIGLYKIEDVEVPVESLALYLNINPRNCGKASKTLMHRLVEIAFSNEQLNNFQKICLSEIHKANGRKLFTNIDIDDKDFDTRLSLSIINQEAFTKIKTRDGYHFLIEHAKIAPEYKSIR